MGRRLAGRDWVGIGFVGLRGCVLVGEILGRCDAMGRDAMITISDGFPHESASSFFVGMTT